MTTKTGKTQVADNAQKAVVAKATVPVVQKTPAEIVATQTYTKLNRAPLPAGVRAFDPNQVITIIASSNPKQPGKMAAARFAEYYTLAKSGTFTVGQYITHIKASNLPGKEYAAADVVFDSDRGYIRVEPLVKPVQGDAK